MSKTKTSIEPINRSNKNMAKRETFTDFRRLKSSVSRLISARSYIGDSDNQESLNSIISLARKIEISNYVQSDDFIAIAGMQGTGKTTIISCLYNLPDGLLDISIGRSERIPVFISEDNNLEAGNYRAECVSVDKDNGALYRDEIPVDSIANHSKNVYNAAFVELFVPTRYNARFVLLPGFEKDENRNFNLEYNSLMDYTLHFAKAVLLVVDNEGLANRDIQYILSMLGEKFSPSNCVFAISKCDLKTEQETEQLKNTLFNECAESNLKISKNQIVCTRGEASDEWHEQLMSCIENNIDYTASQKNYEFFRPMAEEIKICAEKIQDELKLKENSVQTEEKPIWYNPLKTALGNEREKIKKVLEKICQEEKETVYKNFVKAFDGIDKKHKTDKKFVVFRKTEGEKLHDREIIKAVAEKCLKTNDNPPKSKFMEAIKTAAIEESNNYKQLEDSYWEITIDQLTIVDQSQNMNVTKAKQQILQANEAVIASMFDQSIKSPHLKEGEFAGYEHIAALIAYEFKTYFYGLIANYDGQYKNIHSYDNIERVAKNLKKNSKKNSAVKMIAAIDMLDGTPDIATAFVGIGEAFGLGTVMPYVAAAIAISAVATLGVNIYNSIIDQQNTLCRTWVYSLQNAVEEQKEFLLEVYDSACDKLLKHICDVHKSRERIDDTMYRLTNAKYAASDLIHLVADMDTQYAIGMENS